jgi:hypothetical protein
VRRGPVNPVPTPPADLSAQKLPIVSIPQGTTLYRIHRADHGPIFFSPGTGRPPAGRFDSATRRFGILYVGLTFACSFAEVLLRNPGRRIISLSEIEARSLAIIRLRADVRMVDLTGPGLSQLGLDARFHSGGYDVCGAWADALHNHPEQPAGILYPSRFDPSEHCAALFERAASFIELATNGVRLGEMLPNVAAALDRYSKALDPS